MQLTAYQVIEWVGIPVAGGLEGLKINSTGVQAES